MKRGDFPGNAPALESLFLGTREWARKNNIIEILKDGRTHLIPDDRVMPTDLRSHRRRHVRLWSGIGAQAAARRLLNAKPACAIYSSLGLMPSVAWRVMISVKDRRGQKANRRSKEARYTVGRRG